MNEEDFEKAVERYKRELLAEFPTAAASATEQREKAAEEAAKDEKVISSEKDSDIREAASEAKESSQPEPASYGFFSAKVSAGEEAYPVAGAKVVIKRKGEIYSFLETDESGETKKIRLAGQSEKDSLNPQTAESTEYSADVYASGFAEKKDLPIFVLENEESVLTVELIPKDR